MRVGKLLIKGLDTRVGAEVVAFLALVLFHVRTAEFGTIVIVLVIIVADKVDDVLQIRVEDTGIVVTSGHLAVLTTAIFDQLREALSI